MPFEPRLVVTGHNDNGDAVFVDDRHPEPVSVLALPGAEFYQMWGTPDGAATVGERGTVEPVLRPYFPGVGGSRVIFLRWAPHSSEPAPAADPDVVRGDVADKLPGLLDPFEDGDKGMHTTDTVDYAICVEGELCLELDNGAEITLTPGTCVVQRGTRHAWKNKSDRPAFMCYVLIGAVRV